MAVDLISLEAMYIRLRGWFWNLLQLAAILMVIVGSVRLFSQVLVYNDDVLSNAILAFGEYISFLPELGGEAYLVGGLIATLVISVLR